MPVPAPPAAPAAPAPAPCSWQTHGGPRPTPLAPLHHIHPPPGAPIRRPSPFSASASSASRSAACRVFSTAAFLRASRSSRRSCRCRRSSRSAGCLLMRSRSLRRFSRSSPSFVKVGVRSGLDPPVSYSFDSTQPSGRGLCNARCTTDGALVMPVPEAPPERIAARAAAARMTGWCEDLLGLYAISIEVLLRVEV
jgi:hypothetical protein